MKAAVGWGASARGGWLLAGGAAGSDTGGGVGDNKGVGSFMGLVGTADVSIGATR